jgi:hypothetical protein
VSPPGVRGRVRARHLRTALFGTLPALVAVVTACDAWREPLRPRDPNWRRLAVARTPLPDTALRVRWDAPPLPAALSRGSEVDVRISFTNLGDAVWPDCLSGDPLKRDGGYAVRLAYDWEGVPVVGAPRPRRRAELPHPVHPGETITLLVHLVAPLEPGRYRLKLALLQELVVWFDDKGAPALAVPVTIT